MKYKYIKKRKKRQAKIKKRIHVNFRSRAERLAHYLKVRPFDLADLLTKPEGEE